MNLDTANKIKPLLRGFEYGTPENFHCEESPSCDHDAYFIRLHIKDRSFQLQGTPDNFRLVEVGIGENGIGFKTVFRYILTLDINETLQKIRKLS